MEDSERIRADLDKRNFRMTVIKSEIVHTKTSLLCLPIVIPPSPSPLTPCAGGSAPNGGRSTARADRCPQWPQRHQGHRNSQTPAEVSQWDNNGKHAMNSCYRETAQDTKQLETTLDEIGVQVKLRLCAQIQNKLL